MRKRGAIVAKLMAQSLSKAGFDHIITLDLHQKEVQGYFDCPVENLSQEKINFWRNVKFIVEILGIMLGNLQWLSHFYASFKN